MKLSQIGIRINQPQICELLTFGPPSIIHENKRTITMNFVAWLYSMAGIIFMLYTLFRKAPISPVLIIASFVIGLVSNSAEIIVIGGAGGFLAGIVIQLFNKDNRKKGKAIDVLLGALLWAALTLALLSRNIITPFTDEEISFTIGTFALLLAFSCRIPFRRLIPSFADEDERVSLDDIRGINLRGILEYLDEHTLLSICIYIALSLSATALAFGEDAIEDATRHILSGDAFWYKYAFLAFFAIFRFLFTLPLDKWWKPYEDYIMGIIMIMTGYFVYAAITDYYNDNPAEPGSIPLVVYQAISSGIDWIGDLLPDWFFADGWLGIWGFIRSAIAGIISIASPALLIIYPFYFLYEKWHEKKDMCSTLYELTAALLLFPAYIATTMWILKSIDDSNSSAIHAILAIVYSIIFLKAAVIRKRCPKCGASRLSRTNESRYVHDEQIDSVTRRGEILPSGTRIEEEIEHRSQRTENHSDMYCHRCGHQWHEVYNTKKYRRIHRNRFSEEHDSLFRGDDSLLRRD